MDKMMQTTFERNKQMLIDVLSGTNVEICAERHHISKTGVTGAIRSVLENLKEHTEYALEVSAVMDFLYENKETILRYLNEPIPTVPLTPYAKAILQEAFGRFYSRVPKQVAEQWADLKKKFNDYQHKRDIDSIKRWLSTEGYLVDHYANKDMHDFAHEALGDNLSSCTAKKDDNQFTIDTIKNHGHALILETTLTHRNHQARRRWRVELLPE